jgi:small-conductance mechanosensitive channel
MRNVTRHIPSHGSGVSECIGGTAGFFLVMTWIIDSITLTQPTTAQQQQVVVNIALSIGMFVAAAVLGILLRRLLLQRLKKTVLDAWISQTLGVLVIVIPSILGLIGGLAIFNARFVVHIIAQSWSDNSSAYINDGGSIVQTLVIAAIGYGIARTIRAVTLRSMGTSRIDINIRTLFARVLYIIALCVTLAFLLTVWNVPIGIPVAVLGTFTVALTVALQDILRNLVAGFYILIERPFHIGDQVNITSGSVTYVGKVEDIQLRATVLRQTSGEEVSVPNIVIFSNAVINNTHFGERRSMLHLTIPQDDFDRDKTTSQILLLLKKYPEVMRQPEPIIMVTGYETGNILLNVRFWVATEQVIDISAIIYDLHHLLPAASIAVKEPM